MGKVGIFLGAALAALGLAEPGFEARHAADRAINPADVEIRLSTEGGKVRFHLGEQIPLLLSLSSRSGDKYRLDLFTYDRAGRLPLDEFVMEGSGAVDPNADFFGAAVLPYVGGGAGGSIALESTPHVLHLTLNDVFRFDRAGRYRFYVKSNRVSYLAAPGAVDLVHIAPASNVVEIEILQADPVWEQSELDRIAGILQAPGEKTDHALRQLKWLGTPQAVRLALTHARATGHRPDTFTLIGARDRRQAVADLQAYLTDPAVLCHRFEIKLQALFTYIEKDSPELLPHHPRQLNRPGEFARLAALAAARQPRFEELVRAEVERLIPVIERKTGEARQACVDAIASLAPDIAREAKLVPPEDFGLTREELIETFETLPTDQQTQLLNERWDLVRGPDMIPVLKRLVALAQPRPISARVPAFTSWADAPGVPGVAMRRLYETAPLEAFAVLRQDLAGGRPAFAELALHLLPSMGVPEADEAFLKLIQAESLGVLPFIARFGTARLVEPMRKLQAAKDWPCPEQSAFMLFFSRMGSALDPQDSCFQLLLTDLGARHWNIAIERATIARLEDENLESVQAAAGALSAQGSATVEGPLWKRLERWSRQWRGRTGELATNPITGKTAHPGEDRLGDALFKAISSAKSWRLDEPRRKRLLSLCIDDHCRQRWERAGHSGAIPIGVSNGGSIYPPAFRLEGFTGSTIGDLEAKLTQYPAGVTFRWCPQADNPFDSFSPGQREEMFQSLAAFLAARSMILEPYSAQACSGGVVVP